MGGGAGLPLQVRSYDEIQRVQVRAKKGPEALGLHLVELLLQHLLGPDGHVRGCAS